MLFEGFLAHNNGGNGKWRNLEAKGQNIIESSWTVPTKHRWLQWQDEMANNITMCLKEARAYVANLIVTNPVTIN